MPLSKLKRRTHKELRKKILTSVVKSPIDLSIKQISDKTGIDWYTVERQLTFMKGLELVSETFRHRLLRLFKVTELGKQILNKNKTSKEALQEFVDRLTPHLGERPPAPRTPEKRRRESERAAQALEKAGI